MNTLTCFLLRLSRHKYSTGALHAFLYIALVLQTETSKVKAFFLLNYSLIFVFHLCIIFAFFMFFRMCASVSMSFVMKS
jgi:hypothetical protein